MHDESEAVIISRGKKKIIQEKKRNQKILFVSIMNSSHTTVIKLSLGALGKENEN